MDAQGGAPDSDLDRTDRLPMLTGVQVEADVFDDAVPLKRPAARAADGTPLSRLSARLTEQAQALELLQAAAAAQAAADERRSQDLSARLAVLERDQSRLLESLAAKTAALAQSQQEHAALRAALEQLRLQLEDHDAHLRRLDGERRMPAIGQRAELGEDPAEAAAAAAQPPVPFDYVAELVRIDGEHPITHVLSRKTRIGRAQGSELMIDASSVSRHHALILLGPRDVVLEDLNSTNGVLVNGRRITRQLLHDGDLVSIGEVQFRLTLRQAPAVPPGGPGPGARP